MMLKTIAAGVADLWGWWFRHRERYDLLLSLIPRVLYGDVLRGYQIMRRVENDYRWPYGSIPITTMLRAIDHLVETREITLVGPGPSGQRRYRCVR